MAPRWASAWERSSSEPAGAAARITGDGGAGSLDIDEARFPGRGDANTSDGCDSADRRFDINIDLGVSSVVVR